MRHRPKTRVAETVGGIKHERVFFFSKRGECHNKKKLNKKKYQSVSDLRPAKATVKLNVFFDLSPFPSFENYQI